MSLLSKKAKKIISKPVLALQKIAVAPAGAVIATISPNLAVKNRLLGEQEAKIAQKVGLVAGAGAGIVVAAPAVLPLLAGKAPAFAAPSLAGALSQGKDLAAKLLPKIGPQASPSPQTPGGVDQAASPLDFPALANVGESMGASVMIGGAILLILLIGVLRR